MTDTDSDTKTKLRVVAIAASAGGLEATSQLSQYLPSQLPCCYVIAQHVSPSHKSMLVQLLSRETKLKVVELDNETDPESDTIYIPPPGYDVIYNEGKFWLREPAGHPASPKPSADRLFGSLAEELNSRAIGVVLSGTGSDGSYGVQAIREHGGITIAQEPSTCKYDGMPVSAIETGCIDLTLTPQQIGQHIGLILDKPHELDSLRELNETAHRNRDLFEILLSHTLVDFRQYKENTVNRRIQRRMHAKAIDDFDAYVDLCRKSSDEVQALYRDLLISVTRFFREPDQFSALAEAINKKFADRKRTSPIRIWIAGCATGEEAYSIAILFAEALGGLGSIEGDDLQVFATDIDEDALNIARKGSYPISAIADIPEEFLEKYFTVGVERLTVKQHLRSLVMFSRHNIFQDAPFISVDLVSLRNVMIYFNSKLQERVLTRMAYALNTDGLLFLGTSETLGTVESSFVNTEGHARIFQKRDPRMRTLKEENHHLVANARYEMPQRNRARPVPIDEWKFFDLLAKSIVTDGLLINREQTVLRVYGDIAPYSALTASSFGQASLSILKKSLASDASSLALVALKNGEQRSGQWHDVPDDPGKAIQITVYPMPKNTAVAEDLVLVGFNIHDKPEPNTGERSAGNDEYVSHLEDELSRTRDALQVMIEQLQTANEELQSVNEELQSSNEEMQSTNEELETSNEELQSTNEELITVNEELLVNSGQLERATAELTGLISNTPTTLLMLDQGLIVRYASRQAMATFGLKERGAGLGHLSQASIPSSYPKLIEVCSQALTDRQPWETQFQDGNLLNRLHLAPIENAEGVLIGLVLQITSSESILAGEDTSG